MGLKMVILGGCLVAAGSGCVPLDQGAATDIASVAGADQVMAGVVTNLAVEGRRRNYVVAESGFVYQDPQRLEFVRIRATIFDAEGQPSASVTARRGEYGVVDRVLGVQGDVVVVTSRGDTLLAPRIAYDNVLRQFRSDSDFVFKARAGTVRGTGFTADPGLRKLVPGRKER